MNNKIFLEKIAKETGYSSDRCKIINDVLESRIMIGKNNKIKTIEDFSKRLDIDIEEANDIYNKCIYILGNEFKNKLKHPFKSKK